MIRSTYAKDRELSLVNSYLFIDSVHQYKFDKCEDFCFCETLKNNMWCLHYIEKGKLYFKINGDETRVGIGNLLIFPPHSTQEFLCKEKDLTTSYSVYVSGSGVSDLLTDAIFSPDRISVNFVGNITYFPYFFQATCDNINAPYDSHRYLNTNLQILRTFLTLIVEIKRVQTFETPNLKPEKFAVLNPIIDLMQEKYAENISIPEYAKICNLNTCYFVSLFKEYTSRTPHAYILRIKNYNALKLLKNSNFTIEQISEMTGFSSVQSFCRFFKKINNCTPAEYKRNPYLNTSEQPPEKRPYRFSTTDSSD